MERQQQQQQQQQPQQQRDGEPTATMPVNQPAQLVLCESVVYVMVRVICIATNLYLYFFDAICLFVAHSHFQKPTATHCNFGRNLSNSMIVKWRQTISFHRSTIEQSLCMCANISSLSHCIAIIILIVLKGGTFNSNNEQSWTEISFQFHYLLGNVHHLPLNRIRYIIRNINQLVSSNGIGIGHWTLECGEVCPT